MGVAPRITGNRPKRVVGAVSVGHLFSHFYILTFPPLFPLLRDEFGLTNTELGLVVSAGALGPLLFQFPVGRLVSRLGGKRVLVTGLAVTALGTAVAGLGQATFHPAGYALLESVATEETKGRNFSVHTFGGYAGFAVAPLVVGTLGLTFDWRVALAVTGAAGVGYALFLVASMEPLASEGADDDASAGSMRAVATDPPVVGMFVFGLLLAMATKGIQTFGALFFIETYGVSEAVGNTALTVFFVCTAAGVLAGGPLADRLSSARIIVPSLSAAGLLLFLVVSGRLPAVPPFLIGVFGVVGLLTGATLPSRDQVISAVFTGGDGEVFGFVFTGFSLGSLVSPTLLGAATDAAGVAAALALTGVGYVLAVGALLGVTAVDRSPAAATA